MPSITGKEEVLLSLLAHELFQREPQIDASTVDWASVLDEGNRHVVAALLYPGMRRLKGVPEDALDRARGAAIFAAEASASMLSSQQAVLALLQERDIPCAVLKGTSVACLYPHPELRVPGDIDILVDAENMKAVRDTLEENHYALVYKSDMHTCFQKRNILVEVHRRVSVFPDNEQGEFTKKFMLDALRHAQTAQGCVVSFPALTGVYQLISLLAHMERHLISSGIGLRQLCDWAVTIHAQREQIGGAELALLDQCGLLHFAKIATRLCEKRLGLPPCGWSADVPDAPMDSLMRDILDGGNFQSQINQDRFFGDAMTDVYNVEDGTKSSILRSYGRYIRSRIRQEHPWAKSSLWILAFGVFYPARWFVRMLMGKRKKVNLSQAVRSAQSREQFLRELKLYG
ncbi:MAG: nucleotidyltransferase family protein [Bacillota bacterium]|nr:nucleotidyltransferase family protein [Bacillota bacterium]